MTTTVIKNDVLSYLMNKYKSYNKEKLINSARSHYNEQLIDEALKVLVNSIPEKKSTRRCRRVQHPDHLVAIYDCLQLIPANEMPTFEYSNYSNQPNYTKENSDSEAYEDLKNKLYDSQSNIIVSKPVGFTSSVKIELTSEMCETSSENRISRNKKFDKKENRISKNNKSFMYGKKKELLVKRLDLKDLALARREQQKLKTKISEIAVMVKDLKDNINNYMHRKNLDTNGVNNSNLLLKDHLRSQRFLRKKSMAFVQELIDADNADEKVSFI